MSLRGRLLAVLILLNVTVVAVLQLVTWSRQRRWLNEQRESYGFFFSSELRDLYVSEARSPEARAIALLSGERFRDLFHDVLITADRGPARGEPILISPLGASQRDPRSFPQQEIVDGIRRAMQGRVVVPVTPGFCVPLLAGEEVAGGAWYEPRLQTLPALPSWAFGVAVVASGLVFGVLAFWSIGRAMARPFQLLGAAALRVGRGERGVRVPRPETAPELDPLVRQFNAMAEKVEAHAEELAREVRRATEETQRKERALLVSSRLAAMGTLAAGIAHEINNPIGGMLNAVQRLLRAEGLGKRERDYLELIQEGLERVRGTARKVLDFSPRQMQPTAFSLADAVASAKALIEHRLAREGVELRVDIPEGLPQVSGDRHELQQVFLNAFLNSLDVLVGGPEPRWIAASARAVPGHVEVLIEDNGPGCDKETLARVLDPFFSAKGRPDATGLGLFISYSIVKNHGGELEVDSAPGQGFRVRIRLPA